MIELPVKPKPNRMSPMLLDQGQLLRGASTLRVDRPGSRWRFKFAYPPMRQDQADTFTAPLTRAKRAGIRIYLPVRVHQGFPGSPVVDGAGQTGSTLSLRGLSTRYSARVGFWLTIVEADGTGYLHRVVQTTVADDSGDVTLQIEPPLRAPFADGATVHLGKPYIEGFLDGDIIGYDIEEAEFTNIAFEVEEYQ